MFAAVEFIAGSPSTLFSVNDGVGDAVQFETIQGVTVTSDGAVYIADSDLGSNSFVRRANLTSGTCPFLSQICRSRFEVVGIPVFIF